ncbi:hypothetical protein D1227_07295 [Henriciella mobilis]|uniref:hypothetical protein n=1 Tax=Henriciella mobilis TaxID=2305467 RepID=UPI000E668981|nr:hypothetical protein [Henriciella mobilis]RIJ17147.1 hypothetical protein D1231_05895 [Henriciella mobilis]RIJ22754.1 hypothetical protein D1227_07295 [Henriciella mobilis]
MAAQKCFEIFHHYLKTGDATQMLSLADSVEIFGSSSIGDGKTYIGHRAPDKFRECLNGAGQRRIAQDINICHADIESNRGTYVFEIGRGRSRKRHILVLGTKSGKLTTFHEAPVSF